MVATGGRGPADVVSSALRIAAMCSGVVPQQPPTIAAPDASMPSTIAPKYVGSGRVDELAVDPLRAGRRWGGSLGSCRPIAVRASRQPTGPAPQLTPSTSTSTPVSSAAARPASVPSGRAAVLAEREQRDDRQVRGRAPGLLDGEAQVVDQREGLEPEQVDAAFEQAVDGFAIGRPDRRSP